MPFKTPEYDAAVAETLRTLKVVEMTPPQIAKLKAVLDRITDGHRMDRPQHVNMIAAWSGYEE